MNNGYNLVVRFYYRIVTVVFSLGKSFDCVCQNVQNFVQVRGLARAPYFVVAIIHFPEASPKSMIRTRER